MIGIVAAPDADPELIQRLTAELDHRLACGCIIVGEIEIGFAFDAARSQYHSTAILKHLADQSARGRLLAVTAADLFVPILTFVFGEAQIGGRCAVVSYHRLREEFYGLTANLPLLLNRLVKESLHEIGHTFGLRHCDDWECVMASSHSTAGIDVKSAAFCLSCAPALQSQATRTPRAARY